MNIAPIILDINGDVRTIEPEGFPYVNLVNTLNPITRPIQ